MFHMCFTGMSQWKYQCVRSVFIGSHFSHRMSNFTVGAERAYLLWNEMVTEFCEDERKLKPKLR